MNPTHEYWTPDRIRELRGKYGYTQSEFATLLGVARHTLERYEAGEGTTRHLPPAAPVCRLLAILEVAPQWVGRRLRAACALAESR
jgi:transcriptional regulator with XRE-family HTH domain